MRKKTKALSGASQDAYFRRVLKANPNLSADERDQLVRKLRAEVAQLRVRMEPRGEGEPPRQSAMITDRPAAPVLPLPLPPVAPSEPPVPAPAIAAEPAPILETSAAAAVSEPFDPYSPNIVVVVRKSGRAAALAALDAIGDPDNLRLLAREQRLSVGTDIASAADLRAAIVTAAERRIANRMAAAS